MGGWQWQPNLGTTLAVHYQMVVRVAILASDPVFGEALASLLTHSGGFEVVAVTSNPTSVIGEFPTTQVVVVTEELAREPSMRRLLPVARNSGCKSVLLQSSRSEMSKIAAGFDRIQPTTKGLASLFHAVRSLADEGTLLKGFSSIEELSLDSQARTSSVPDQELRESRPECQHMASVSQLGAAVRSQVGLSARLVETSELLLQGCSNAEIASVLGVSYNTAKLYVGRLLKHYGYSSRVQLILHLQQHRGGEPVAQVSVS